MNLRALLFVFVFFNSLVLLAQERDSTYIQPYPQDIWLHAYIPTKILMVTQENKVYSPNYPYSLGVGIGLRKVLGFNILYAQNLFRLRDETNLETTSIDIQAHKYGKRFLLDAYYQDYTGFYIENSKDNYTLFPTLSTQQIGVEGTYVLNSNKFSARAAFEQSECQVKSAGSWLLGSGFYWHRIEPDTERENVSTEAFENFQIGFHGGYAYSWVAGKRWLLTGAFIGGLNFGNQTDELCSMHIKVYPTTMTRFSFVYLKNDWAVSLSGIFNNKSVYPTDNKPIRLITPTVQLSVTKHFFLKKNHFLTRIPSPLKERPTPVQNG